MRPPVLNLEGDRDLYMGLGLLGVAALILFLSMVLG